MAGHGNSATPEQRNLALDALLSGASMQEAADAANVARSTISRWVYHDADFQERLARERQKITRGVRTQLAIAAQTAVNTLIELMVDVEQQGSVRRAAAHDVLEFLGLGPDIEAGVRQVVVTVSAATPPSASASDGDG